MIRSSSIATPICRSLNLFLGFAVVLGQRRQETEVLCKSNENTNLMQHCAGFISAGSLYMFRAQAPIIRSI